MEKHWEVLGMRIMEVAAEKLKKQGKPVTDENMREVISGNGFLETIMDDEIVGGYPGNTIKNAITNTIAELSE